ncbi:DUF292-domain-containing protein [Metschnikowia bicuspidata var. bicuspidata NRRL YB-4993]|uniref:DUF292-domain-containing protein n=1 Tax=Metschnikowia bicuspidata var. bicuspidata NRRL YB-4993 TaxID=869754 RepID=A0A1A0H9T2_9ASCO|nr:DUF292-domain-containing protein [Metschnikowia bicuspidata var. bicuspidata NRRL YB-4993]OBA20755.1 DUF292-domain-containing protein [Metschnikowia bicuspidata var. bicuspidata NRRL YB-4993]
MPPPSPLNAQRLRTTLKMAISKLKFLQEKKTAITKQQRRQMADLLSAGKETSAKIRVENIIRDDVYIELLEYCELFCELLLARSQIVLDILRSEVDGGIQDAVLLIIYCCNFTEVKEMVTLGEILRLRYGPEYTRKVLENEGGSVVPPKIVSRCDIEPPLESLVNLYLGEIAKTFEVPFSGVIPDDSEPESNDDSDLPDGGVKVSVGEGTEETDPESALVAGKITPKTVAKRLVSKAQAEKSEFDKLQERFAALRK